jgi:hypothetical protein
MKKPEKEQTSKPTEFDKNESVGDSALAENKKGNEEPKPLDEDESVGGSNRRDVKKGK